MKRILFYIIVLFTICSCESNNEIVNSPKDGNYIYKNGSTAISLRIKDSKFSSLYIFIDNNICLQSFECKTTGEYPNYSFSYYNVSKSQEWILQAKFIDNNSFIATTTGNLYHNLTNAGKVDYDAIINFPSSMTFILSDEILDINHDGVLDSSQDL